MEDDEIEKLAESGDVQAQVDLATRFMTMYYMFLAINGGKTTENLEDYIRQSIYWYRRAAEQGDANAQNNLGDFYYAGNVVKQDYREAFYWFKRAAEQGVVGAITRLGDCYGFGRGVEVNEPLAFKWYKKAAELGDYRAKLCLAICYLDEVGIRRDVESAVCLLNEVRYGNHDDMELKKVAKDILTDLGRS